MVWVARLQRLFVAKVGPLLVKEIFFAIFSAFFHFDFAECRALDKVFAECPTKDTWQSTLCR
jgi:hypothetical protein